MKTAFALTILLFTLTAQAITDQQLLHQKTTLMELAVGRYNSFAYAFGEIGRKRLIENLENYQYEGAVLDLLKSEESLEYDRINQIWPLGEAFIEAGYPRYGVEQKLSDEITLIVLNDLPNNYDFVLTNITLYEAIANDVIVREEEMRIIKPAGYYLPGNVACNLVEVMGEILLAIQKNKSLSLNKKQIEDSYRTINKYLSTNTSSDTETYRTGMSVKRLLMRLYPR